MFAFFRKFSPKKHVKILKLFQYFLQLFEQLMTVGLKNK